MTYTQLSYFVSAAEKLNLTRVAEEYHVSQPAISAAIAAIERECHTALFQRRHNQIVLTEAGENVYRKGRDLIRHYDEFEQFLSSELLTSKTARCSFAPNVASIYLADLYRYLGKALPEYQLSLIEINNASAVNLLKSGQLDLACFSTPPERMDPELCYVPVGVLKLCFCAKRNIFRSEKKEITIRDLEGIPLVIHQRSATQNRILRDLFQRAGIQPNIIYESYQTSTLCTLVRKGIAMGCYLPEVLLEDDPDVGIYYLEEANSYPLYCVYRDREKSSAQGALLKAIRSFFREET